MQVIVDDQLVEYQLMGSGSKTILLLHGWTDSAHTSFVDLGSKLSTHYQVVLPDLPGFGKSAPPPATWGIPEYSHFIRQFMGKLGIKPDSIIAHSNGGTLAIYTLAHDLLKPKKLVLISSAGIRSTTSSKRAALRIAAKPVKFLLKPLPSSTQARIKKRAYNRLGSDLYVLEHMKPIFKRVLTYDAQKDAQLIKAQTLLVYGANDTSTPPAFGHLFASTITDARLEIVSGAGHYVHIDQPAKTYQLVKDFLA